MNEEDAEWVYIAYLTLKNLPPAAHGYDKASRGRCLIELRRILTNHGYDFAEHTHA